MAKLAAITTSFNSIVSTSQFRVFISPLSAKFTTQADYYQVVYPEYYYHSDASGTTTQWQHGRNVSGADATHGDTTPADDPAPGSTTTILHHPTGWPTPCSTQSITYGFQRTTSHHLTRWACHLGTSSSQSTTTKPQQTTTQLCSSSQRASSRQTTKGQAASTCSTTRNTRLH